MSDQKPAAEAPLENYRIVGMRENWYNPVPEVKQPGGSCWHCGTGIAYEVVIQNKTTGETHTIGTTCAERVGMSTPELKEWLAGIYAEQRAEIRRTRSKEYREEVERIEAETTAEHGAHGTESRFRYGCGCHACFEAAPHGTWQRFNQDCRCLDCVDFVVLDGKSDSKYKASRYTYGEVMVIVELATGEVVDAKLVDGQWGSRWAVHPDGGGTVWLGLSPKRRSTQAKHGFVQAWATYLCENIKTRQGNWRKPIWQASEPLVDYWGEPIAHEAAEGVDAM